MKESEIIQQFLDLIDGSRQRYKEAEEIVKLHEKKETDFKHRFEFATNKAERNKLATEFHRSRVERRAAKDEKQRVEKIVQWADANNITLQRLRGLLREQTKVEEYLDGERHYNDRVKE